MKILDIPQVGKLGMTVTWPGRYGLIRRQWVVPSNPRTVAQLNVRSILTLQSSRFDGLTPTQQDAWTAAAALVQSKPSLGQSGPLTGLQLFSKINATLALYGQEPVDAPTVKPTFAALAPQNLTITNTGGVIAIALTCPADPGVNTTLRGSSPQHSGVRALPSLRILGMVPAPAAGKSYITALYTARYGVPAVGSRIFVQCALTQDGWMGPAMSFTAVVPAEA